MKKQIGRTLNIISWDMCNVVRSVGEKAEKFETEDTAFNGAFCSACDDRSEAFYLLTPQLMHKLYEIYSERCLAGKPELAFLFKDDMLHVVLMRNNAILDLDDESALELKDRTKELQEELKAVMSISEILDDIVVTEP